MTNNLNKLEKRYSGYSCIVFFSLRPYLAWRFLCFSDYARSSYQVGYKWKTIFELQLFC